MQRLRAAIDTVTDALADGATVLGAVLLALVTLVSGAELVARSLTGSSWIEAGDLAMLFAVAMYFTGYPALLNRDEDIRMDYFYLRLPPRLRRGIDLAAAAAIVLFFVVLVVKAIVLFRMGLRFRHPVLALPAAAVYAPLVIGAAFGLLVAIRKLLDLLADLGRPAAPPRPDAHHP